jgi:hypothetical protein
VPKLRPFQRDALAALVQGQAGVVSRAQALGHGMSDSQIRSLLAGGGWRCTDVEGVYLSFTGPMTDVALCWVALLYAGKGALLCRDTAAWLWELSDTLARPIHVMLPTSRRVTSQAELVAIHYSIHRAARVHPARSPPVTKLDDTVLDLVDCATRPTEVIDVVTRSCQRRLTSAARLGGAAGSRKKLAWRALLADLLTEVATGVQSPLEQVYVRDVERAHSLPRGQRNAPEGETGRHRYRDVRYGKYRLVVELDGTAAHPVEARDRDDVRDNELVECEGTSTLRYGWVAVTGRPCHVAAQVARVLVHGGWSGTAVACGPGCPVGSTPSR